MAQSLRERVSAFPTWHYQFDLGDGVVTPIFDAEHVNRHRQRQRLIVEPLLQVCGGDLRGKRVLDLGCNAGYWSLQAVEHGCDFVLGVDGRQMHVDQAELVFEAKGVDRGRYSFVRGNLFDLDLDEHGPFDVVLCLGLMYHISKPVELFEIISRVGSDLLVLDTEVSLARGASFRMRRESLGTARNSVDYESVLVPSRRAVVQLARQFGYQVRVVRPDIDDPTGMADFRSGKRRVFLAAKQSDLSGVPADAEVPSPLDRPRWAAELVRRRVLKGGWSGVGGRAGGVTG